MQTSFNICLLAAAIDLGLSLTCEICGGFGDTCVGSVEFCPPGEDKCGITLLEGTRGLEARSIAKTCVPSNSCDEPFTSVNLGEAGEARTHLSCCVGNDCQRIIPTLPPLNNTPNGKICPACYTVNSLECEEETVECTGDQLYCLEKSGSINIGGQNVATIIKGCANRAFCNNMHAHSFFDRIHNVVTATCTAASAAASVAPGMLGLFLPAVAGFLLLNMQD